MGEILLLIKQQKCSVNIKQHKMYIYPENVHKQIDSGGFSNAVVTFISLLLFFSDQNEIQDFCGLN